ncbi:MAG: cupin domain-containing protein [Gallicola sp.]|uniref:cupin domain-containing protein n=1 Tax=Gallicola sp. Sow4_E12 TaxID=3438785 RepID=UPI0017B47CAC|nr:cupin domain-containing protein [Gallicola sp.]
MNLFETLNFSKDFEITDTILENEKIKIERILSSGQSSDVYDQNEDEWVLVLEGESVLETEGKEIPLKKGDHYYIKAHEKHRVLYTSENCLWLCIFVK